MKTPADWVRLVCGLAIVFALFQWLGTALHSDRGQAGTVIALLVVGAIVVVDVAFFGRRWQDALGAIRFGKPQTSNGPVAK